MHNLLQQDRKDKSVFKRSKSVRMTPCSGLCFKKDNFRSAKPLVRKLGKKFSLQCNAAALENSAQVLGLQNLSIIVICLFGFVQSHASF